MDFEAPSHPLPHFWEQLFGSGRAALSLRESYRNDLRTMKKSADFRYVRFHGIFHDELGLYQENEKGEAVYNFTYIDQVYDGLLANGVRPMVEIGFMPKQLALRQDVHPFWWKPIVSPPKDYAKWDALIQNFAAHLVERYGIEEVSQWYFEVWNEPNIDFWTGDPKLETYFELYHHTALALKSVDQRLRVGGPSTAAASWVDKFLDLVAKNKSPIDFVSSHAYADDTVWNLFQSHEDIPMHQRVCRAIKKVKKQITDSSLPHLPLMWTEWSVPSFGDVLSARDTSYVAAALAENIKQCDGSVDMMSYWTFSDVFEENGVRKQPFDGGFGLMGAGGIKKPGVNGFELLHRLGSERIEHPSENLLVTKRSTDGALVMAAWNLVALDQEAKPLSLNLNFPHLSKKAEVFVSRVDETHGNSLTAYKKMGRPRYPTRAQIDELNRAAELPPPERMQVLEGKLHLTIPANGLVLLEFPTTSLNLR